MKNRFDEITLNAVGDDNFPLEFGSKGQRVSQLHKALDKLGAKIGYGERLSRKFKDDTKSALTSLGYPVSLIRTRFDEIISKGAEMSLQETAESGSGTSTVIDQSQLDDLYKKYVNRVGINKAMPKSEWIKRQEKLTKWKEIGKGIFQVGTDWLKANQLGQIDDPGKSIMDDSKKDNKIAGMPAPVVYIGGAIAAGLIIWGIVSIAKRKPQQVIVQPPIAP